jgi:MoaA/NifB/PqqE/SkfB family radical SAM enzyme
MDGPPALHNNLRGSPRAFDKLAEGLESVRAAGIPFGLIMTVTPHNWEHLVWAAEFAAAAGARLLQLHPLELKGRAQAELASDAPDDDLLAKVYVLAFVLATKYEASLKVQLDVLHREHVRAEPGLVYAADEPLAGVPAELLGLLVLEPDGTVVPAAYGLSREYQVCNIDEQGLQAAWPRYLREGYPSFRTLCRGVWHKVCAPDAPLLLNWHERVVAQSHAVV